MSITFWFLTSLHENMYICNLPRGLARTPSPEGLDGSLRARGGRDRSPLKPGSSRCCSLPQRSRAELTCQGNTTNSCYTPTGESSRRSAGGRERSTRSRAIISHVPSISTLGSCRSLLLYHLPFNSASGPCFLRLSQALSLSLLDPVSLTLLAVM